jgi:hypothetical protein
MTGSCVSVGIAVGAEVGVGLQLLSKINPATNRQQSMLFFMISTLLF